MVILLDLRRPRGCDGAEEGNTDRKHRRKTYTNTNTLRRTSAELITDCTNGAYSITHGVFFEIDTHAAINASQ